MHRRRAETLGFQTLWVGVFYRVSASTASIQRLIEMSGARMSLEIPITIGTIGDQKWRLVVDVGGILKVSHVFVTLDEDGQPEVSIREPIPPTDRGPRTRDNRSVAFSSREVERYFSEAIIGELRRRGVMS